MTTNPVTERMAASGERLGAPSRAESRAAARTKLHHCPFELRPRQRGDLSMTQTKNVRFLKTGEEMAPWTGYYMRRRGVLLAVEIFEGVWFKIRRRGETWEAYQVVGSSPEHRNSPADNDDDDDDEVYEAPRTRRRRNEGNDLLDGTHPAHFSGDRAQTRNFLRKFQLYMRINDGAAIARDPLMKALFFLSLVEGPAVEWWLIRNSDWLMRVERDPGILPPDKNEWEIIEDDFKQSFIDSSEPERAHLELLKLRMKDGQLDDYVSAFRMLTNQAGMDPNNPPTLQLFARGLPTELAEACIDHESTESFEQWVNAARSQYHNWLRTIHPTADFIPNETNRFVWRTNTTSLQNNAEPNRPRVAPRDDNRMKVDAIRRATSDAEKERHRKEGRCFECSQQGHLARNCPRRPSRPPRARTAAADERQGR